MKIYLAFWISIFGFFLLLQYTTSNTTVSDSTIINYIVENSTDASFDKQLETNYQDSNDSFSSNNVNTGPLHSSQFNEECKNGDCTRNVYTSLSIDNSSSASKILWNLVNTIKSTIVEPSSNDEMNIEEEIALSSLNNADSSHSNVHNSSFYSSGNELDSKINFEYDLPGTTHSSEVINNSSPIHMNVDYDFNTTSSESVVQTTKILDKLHMFEENSSQILEATKIYPGIVTSNSNILDVFNGTKYAVTSETPETTIYGADDELDFTSHFLNSFNENATEFIKEIKTQSDISENLTTEIPFSESDDTFNYEYNESSTLFSVNNDSDILESKAYEMVNNTNLETYTSSYGESSIPLVLESEENSTLVSFNYGLSAIYEELESEGHYEINSTDSSHNTPMADSVFVTSPDMKTSPDGSLWLISEDMINHTHITSVADSFIVTELPQNESDISLNHENDLISSDSDIHLSQTSENIYSTFSVTTEKMLLNEVITHISTKVSEVVDHDSNLSQEKSHDLSTSQTGVFHNVQNFSRVVYDSSAQSTDIITNGDTTNGSMESTEVTYFSLPVDTKTSSPADVLSTVHNLSTNLDDSTERLLGRINTIVSHDLAASEIIKQNTSLFTTSREIELSDKKTISTNSNEELLSSSVMPNTDPNINTVHLNNVHVFSTQASHHLNSLNDMDTDLSSAQTNHGTIASDSKLEETVTIFPVAANSSFAVYPVKENSFEAEISVTTQNPDKVSVLTENNFKTETAVSNINSYKILTSTENSDNESNTSSQIPGVFLTTEEEDENNVYISKISSMLNYTDPTPVEIPIENTDNQVQKEESETFLSATTEPVLISEHINFSTNSAAISSSENAKLSTTGIYYHESTSDQREKNMETTINEKENVRESNISEDMITDTKQFDTVPISTTLGIEVKTSSSVEVSSLEVTETHREGKHIPFSSTLVKSTTEYPRIFNVTIRTFSHSPESETTQNNFINLRYNQIKAEELSPEERSNLINAIVKLPDNSYSKEVLNEKIATIHLWLLHAIAHEYKNATLNLSDSNDGQLDEIEFENLPQILYVLPTPEIYLPNISFTFVVHNEWRNETFPVDLILTILNLHTEDLKHLVEIEEIHFSHGLLVQNHDLLSVIIEKYGIILLSTCLITVGMILLLICVVVYYRRKTRHSAHCLTDDKLHRNMQEAMGIDLNPAVVILQDEIREKAALNGNKICSLDDDEGWLAPIGDVPVGEDNNAPFVQDTKL